MLTNHVPKIVNRLPYTNQQDSANIVNVIKCHKNVINAGVARAENVYLEGIDGNLRTRRTEVRVVVARYHAGRGQLFCVHPSTEAASVSVIASAGE